MIDVVLTRLQSSHQNLRSDEIEGTAPSLPQVGKNFILFGDPLAKGAIARLVATTPVKRLHPHLHDEVSFRPSATVCLSRIGSRHRHLLASRARHASCSGKGTHLPRRSFPEGQVLT